MNAASRRRSSPSTLSGRETIRSRNYPLKKLSAQKLEPHVLPRMNSSPTDRRLPRWLAILFLTLCGFAGALQADENASPQEGSLKPQDAVKKPAAEDRSSRATARAKGDLTFDDLKFAIEKGAPFERSMLTQEIEGLNKKTIRIRGYILPASVFKQTGIDEFVLVRDNMECCFGPGAAIYDCIMIKMEKGKTADFTTRPVAVKGKFEVEELKFPDGTHYAIYKLTATEAK